MTQNNNHRFHKDGLMKKTKEQLIQILLRKDDEISLLLGQKNAGKEIHDENTNTSEIDYINLTNSELVDLIFQKDKTETQLRGSAKEPNEENLDKKRAFLMNQTKEELVDTLIARIKYDRNLRNALTKRNNRISELEQRISELEMELSSKSINDIAVPLI